MKLFSTLVFTLLLTVTNLHSVTSRFILEQDINRHNNFLHPSEHRYHNRLERRDLDLNEHMSQAERICLMIFRDPNIKNLCNSDVLSRLFNQEHVSEHEIYLDEYEDVVRTYHSGVDIDNNVLETPVDPHTRREALLNVYESLCVNGLALSCYKILE